MSADTELHYLDITELGQRFRDGSLSPVTLAEALLERIDVLDDRLQVFVTLLRDDILNHAKAADKTLREGGDLGPLHGIPLGIKDLYDTQGVRTTSCSKVRENYKPQEDATTVAKLREAGGIVLGKVATHEFAFGFDAPPARNAWNTEHTPSGSSGGSGAGLGAGFFPGATGSDTGGSIRAPAAANGISGIKPTFGRVSKHGVAVLSWTLDHTGPMARSARDLALMLQVMAGADLKDPTTIGEPVPDYCAALSGDVKGLTLGVPKNYFFDDLISEVSDGVRNAIDVLGEAGATIVEVTISDIEHLLENFFSIVVPEAAAYHTQSFREMPEAYNDDVRELLEQGNIVFATTYINALRSRNIIRNGFRKAFDGIDAMLVPGLPVTAPKVGQSVYDWGSWQEPIFRAHARLNCPFNLCGLPAATIPCGFADDGLPVGLQIAGKPFDEATVLRIADAFQQRTDWHLRRPAL